MILIHRGDEPEELTLARNTHLPQLRVIAARGAPTQEQITGYGPPAVRDALRSAQREKCCYCERGLDSRDELDHHRPKTRARRSPGSELTHGYWCLGWLAHSWLNLLYACRGCNNEKGTQFPLDAGSVPLAADQAPPGGELPLLIDPASTDGMLHIHFELVQVDGGKNEWTPRPRSPLGKWTIRVCKLDRGSLLDAYGNHVKLGVVPKMDKVKEALRGREPREVHRAVHTATRSLLNPNQCFLGLSYDALRYFVPDTQLAPYGLCWHRPA